MPSIAVVEPEGFATRDQDAALAVWALGRQLASVPRTIATFWRRWLEPTSFPPMRNGPALGAWSVGLQSRSGGGVFSLSRRGADEATAVASTGTTTEASTRWRRMAVRRVCHQILQNHAILPTASLL
jgi:hypothetical protein